MLYVYWVLGRSEEKKDILRKTLVDTVIITVYTLSTSLVLHLPSLLNSVNTWLCLLSYTRATKNVVRWWHSWFTPTPWKCFSNPHMYYNITGKIVHFKFYATQLYWPTMCTPNEDDINMLYGFAKTNSAMAKHFAYRSVTLDELSSLNLFLHLCLMIVTAERRQGVHGGESGDNA